MSIYDWLDAYGKSHQNKTNKKIHWVCVPAIMVTLLGLLSMVNFSFTIDKEFYHINLASILIILAISFSSILGILLFPNSSKGKIVEFLAHDIGLGIRKARQCVKLFSDTGRTLFVRAKNDTTNAYIQVRGPKTQEQGISFC